MPRPVKTINPWEHELLRLGRRTFQRGATATREMLTLGGFGGLEPALAGVAGQAPDGFDRVVSILEHQRERARRVDESRSPDE
jgi:hypothetical protein